MCMVSYGGESHWYGACVLSRFFEDPSFLVSVAKNVHYQDFSKIASFASWPSGCVDSSHIA